MGEGKQGTMVVHQLPNQNLIEQLRAKYNELATGFQAWLAKQSLPVEAAVVTTASAARGAVLGAIIGNIPGLAPTPPPGFNLDPNAAATFKQVQALAGRPILLEARNYAVMTGVDGAIFCVLKRVRGKEDIQSSMAAAFGSGVMYSLVSSIGGPHTVPCALTSGVCCALNVVSSR